MAFGNPVRDHEAQPGPTATRFVRLPESVEEMRNVFGRDSNTGVFYPKSNGIAVAIHGECHVAAAWSELDGVTYEVAHRLDDAVDIGIDPQRRPDRLDDQRHTSGRRG